MITLVSVPVALILALVAIGTRDARWATASFLAIGAGALFMIGQLLAASWLRRKR